MAKFSQTNKTQLFLGLLSFAGLLIGLHFDQKSSNTKNHNEVLKEVRDMRKEFKVEIDSLHIRKN